MTASYPIAALPIASGPTYAAVSTSMPSVTVAASSCFHYITAGDVASRALRLILVESPDAPLQPDEYADFLNVMNSYMADLEASGIRLGYNEVCNVSDLVVIPNGAIRGLVANMAVEMAPMFGGRVTAALIKQANEGLKTMRRLGVHVGESAFPVTLPLGSSYRRCDYVAKTPFAQMSIAGNRRETVIDTAASAVKAQGVWTVGSFYGLRPDVSGRITNIGEFRTVTISANLVIVGESTIATGFVGITRNAAIALYTDASFTTDPALVEMSGTIDLEPGDFIDFVLADYAGTANMTLTEGFVSLI